MSNSATLLDTIATNQSNKEVVVNALLDAASPAMLWGRHASACSGLAWGYYGGTFVDSTGAVHAIANGALTLTASTTNYLYADGTTGAVSSNTTGFPTGKVPLYTIVVGTTTVTSYTDDRSYQPSATAGAGGGAGTVTSVALTAPSIFSVAGSPITAAGTLALTLIAQAVNTVFAGPSSGSSAAPGFRALVPADYPVFVASGASHAAGAVPDPGATAGTTRYLREDSIWSVPAGGGGSNIVNLLSYSVGTPGGSARLMQAITPQATTLPISLTGSYGYCDGAPTAAVVCTINKISAGVTTAIGAVNYAIGATSATFTFSAGVVTAAGDMIQILAPATPDATFAGPTIALVGTR